ncbi:MAG: membrane protein insertase YidC [Clostridium celatum]|uniref:membrane protein insertase YidC n=1 Tax=Clostridium sp. TaxID=1506 RepID=UPI0025C58E9B|nr:membrane protein insertase YidC [Clostridium sp.]MBS4957611.1 membrane protein insertase YidC [Clostridium sp.]MDU4884516.1 membrane protein insertase YidC [Clostridium celatum]MDU5260830.1 membrane protein insertase YidC [Clostridium celatum]MDU7077685.1 membrane protein insertase YidC [Clostridium celatum]
MWNAIVDVMTKMFEALHKLIIALGVPENSEGVSYVLAIILFTAIIRLLILPLNIKSTKSNAKMQEIQPEMKKLQAKYANDPQKLQLETSKLMKENNVSMFGGCLPALLPLPILFALYGVFRNITATPGADTSFLFIPDIFDIPGGFISIILAILSALSTYIPSLLLSKSMPQQEGGMNMSTMNIVMSGMMGFMSLQFQPILVIYWITGGIIQLIQTYFLNYLPAMKKKKIEEEKAAQSKIEKAKKSTPKTKKR